MTKLDVGLITSLPASDPGSAAVWGSKRINPRPQFCLCLAWSGCPSNDDDDDDDDDECLRDHVKMAILYKSKNISKISYIYELEVAKFIHSFNQKRFPKNFNMSFKPTNQFHNYQTRSLTNENY